MEYSTMMVRADRSLLTDQDTYLFKEGTHYRLFDKLGAHLVSFDGVEGVYFAVWAPNARRVSVLGDFNQWEPGRHILNCRWDGSGIWEGFLPGVKQGALYKYFIESRFHGYSVEKKDPVGFFCEKPPRSASIVWDLSYSWRDEEWMRTRHRHNALDKPFSVYEVHLGSWRRVEEEGRWRSLTYRETADLLVKYVKDMGFTHVEFMPLLAHPFSGSWGYQVDGYFSPASAYGSPQELMRLIDVLHQNGIGVIMDWVPSHFPTDGHSLGYFDGTHLYEHSDPRKGFHPDWKSHIFNYGRNEVKAFLVSSALFWLEKYHLDGLRVDGVASMLYLDYSRQDGQWLPNHLGGRENLEAVEFLKSLNEAAYLNYPDIQMIAEESTSWPMVSRPTSVGGLGFGMKWNMGWMHDTLQYFQKDPVHRKYHHNELTFSLWYAFTENFMLSLSHDEVVHGKGALLRKMPGDDWQKFANLRLLLGYMYAHPGKKLLFMGGEFGQWDEWNHDGSLDWHLLAYEPHQGVQAWVRDLNLFYRQERTLYEDDFSQEGFTWICADDDQNSVLSFLRKTRDPEEILLVVVNMTPVHRIRFRVGVPESWSWTEVLSSDDRKYGGSHWRNEGEIIAEPTPWQGQPRSIEITLPTLSILFFKQRSGS